MIRKRPEKDTVNPPGQIRNPPSPDTLKHNIEEWKRYEQSRNKPPKPAPGLGRPWDDADD